MDRALIITIRFHQSRYHGSGNWPPSPGRLFQALVAGAALGRKILPEDCDALKWLEGLGAPRIVAPRAFKGQKIVLFVPNNDLDAVGGDPSRIDKIRTAKSVQPYCFDADLPIRYIWLHSSTMPATLPDIAQRLFRLGLGQDPAWAIADDLGAEEAESLLAASSGILHEPRGHGHVQLPNQGTLKSLIDRHDKTIDQLTKKSVNKKKSKTLFFRPPKPYFKYIGYDQPPHRFHFDLWKDDAFALIPLDKASLLVDGLSKAAAKKLHDKQAELLIVGCKATDTDKAMRVRVIPIPSIGHQETDPSIRRIMIEVPQECPIERGDIVWAFDGLTPHDPATGEALCEGTLVKSEDLRMAQRYLGNTCRWRSITAAALPSARRRRIPPDGSNPKVGSERTKEEHEAIRAVHRALDHAGIHARAIHVEVQREPFHRREKRSEVFADSTRFDKHAMWHLNVTFDRPLRGPLLLGDGRYKGLGLLVPDDETGTIRGCWQLVSNTPLPEAPLSLCKALRRAVMSRAKATFDKLPELIHGHSDNGSALRKGNRRHLAFAADLARNRLLVLAPHLADRRDLNDEESRCLHRLDRDRVMLDLKHLVAGSAGKFDLTVLPIEENDPILSGSKTWESQTDYTLTRHPRRTNLAEATVADVSVECRRRNLPPPKVTILSSNGLTCRLQLVFSRPVTGPILLGRTAMLGGGLFSPCNNQSE